MAWATSTPTIETRAMQNSMTSIIRLLARPTAASSTLPRRPTMAMSVIIMAISAR